MACHETNDGILHLKGGTRTTQISWVSKHNEKAKNQEEGSGEEMPEDGEGVAFPDQGEVAAQEEVATEAEMPGTATPNEMPEERVAQSKNTIINGIQKMMQQCQEGVRSPRSPKTWGTRSL